MKNINFRNYVPKPSSILNKISKTAGYIQTALQSPRKRNCVSAFAVAGGLFGFGAGYGLGELNQNYQMEIQGVSAEAYDQRQIIDTAIGIVFYGAAGTAFGLAFAGAVRDEKELAELRSQEGLKQQERPAVISDKWIGALAERDRLRTSGLEIEDLPPMPSPYALPH